MEKNNWEVLKKKKKSNPYTSAEHSQNWKRT